MSNEKNLEKLEDQDGLQEVAGGHGEQHPNNRRVKCEKTPKCRRGDGDKGCDAPAEGPRPE